jgi:hypothetical protein
MKALKFWVTIATICRPFTLRMNGSHIVGQELARSLFVLLYRVHSVCIGMNMCVKEHYLCVLFVGGGSLDLDVSFCNMEGWCYTCVT